MHAMMPRHGQSLERIAPLGTLFDLDPLTLGDALGHLDQPAYRAKQLLEWVYRHGVESYDQMLNLPKMLRDRLGETIPFYESQVKARHDSADETVKLLLEWPDGATSECVLIPEGARRTACISTQVGCPVGCVFCASGIGGLERNLTAGQIIEQAMRISRLGAPDGARLTNVVFMGLGEPLANYAATVRAVRAINAAWGMGIGARKLTISTVGLPRQMRMLAEEGLQVTLALSLHAPTDDLRREIIPWAKRVPIAELIDASKYYFERTGREVTLEYILLGGLNDAPAHATELSRICRNMRANVNLIAYNPVPDLPYQRPAESRMAGFLKTLRDRGVNAHVRRSRGLDIEAACGQLRRRDRISAEVNAS